MFKTELTAFPGQLNALYLRPGWTPATARENTVFLSTHLVGDAQSRDNGWSPAVVAARAGHDDSPLDGTGLLVVRHGVSLHNYVAGACSALYPDHKVDLHHLVPDPPLYESRQARIGSHQPWFFAPGTHTLEFDFVRLGPPRLALRLPLSKVLPHPESPTPRKPPPWGFTGEACPRVCTAADAPDSQAAWSPQPRFHRAREPLRREALRVPG